MRFSIIVPAHNAEDRITKCLDSIKQQTFTDYELLVICDACSDKTAEIAESYGAKVFNVKYCNAGLTRNVGLDNAQGEYVLFLDDDDWWLHEYVLDQINRKLTDEDVLCFAFIWKGMKYADPLGNGGNEHFVAVWNKCWKRSFIDTTRFSDATPGEDTDFHWTMWRKNPKYVDWNMPMYYYNYMRDGSISKKYYG
jgi:glycosyltransferase involved in cell wall biosynthesis